MQQRFWLGVMLLFLSPLVVHGYTLSEQDYETLKADILAHPAEFQAYVDSNDFAPIAAAYSQPASPECWVWKTSIAEADNYEVTSDLPSSWDWDLFTGLTVPVQNGWLRLFARGGIANPSLDNVRAALDKIWKPPATAQKSHILAVWRRLALRGEKLYAQPQTGACSKATPAKLVFEGQVSYGMVNHALTGAPVQ